MKALIGIAKSMVAKLYGIEKPFRESRRKPLVWRQRPATVMNFCHDFQKGQPNMLVRFTVKWPAPNQPPGSPRQSGSAVPPGFRPDTPEAKNIEQKMRKKIPRQSPASHIQSCSFLSCGMVPGRRNSMSGRSTNTNREEVSQHGQG